MEAIKSLITNFTLRGLHCVFLWNKWTPFIMCLLWFLCALPRPTRSACQGRPMQFQVHELVGQCKRLSADAAYERHPLWPGSALSIRTRVRVRVEWKCGAVTLNESHACLPPPTGFQNAFSILELSDLREKPREVPIFRRFSLPFGLSSEFPLQLQCQSRFGSSAGGWSVAHCTFLA